MDQSAPVSVSTASPPHAGHREAPRFVARRRPSRAVRNAAAATAGVASPLSWRETCLLAGACPSDDFE